MRDVNVAKSSRLRRRSRKPRALTRMKNGITRGSARRAWVSQLFRHTRERSRFARNFDAVEEEEDEEEEERKKIKKYATRQPAIKRDAFLCRAKD